MANYNSELTGAQIESALTAINGVASNANNGKILCVNNGVITAKSAIEIQGGTIDSLNITANGTYNHAALGGYSPVVVNVPTSGVMTQLSVTANGVYTPSAGVGGFNSVTVNVSGGAGTTKAIIRAYYPSGSVCTCTKGGTSLQSDTSGKYLFCLPSSGTWTVTCGAYSKQITIENFKMEAVYVGALDVLKTRCAATAYARISDTVGDTVTMNGRGFTKTSDAPYLLFFVYNGTWNGYGVAAFTQNTEYTKIDSDCGGIAWQTEYTPVGGQRICIGRLPSMWTGYTQYPYTSGGVTEYICRPPYFNHSTEEFEGDNASDLIDIVKEFSNLQ